MWDANQLQNCVLDKVSFIAITYAKFFLFFSDHDNMNQHDFVNIFNKSKVLHKVEKANLSSIMTF